MKPSIGRIVHYATADGHVLPAIVTEVHNDTCVNLRVFTDSSENPWHLTSVLFDGHGAAECWRWPPRV